MRTLVLALALTAPAAAVAACPTAADLETGIRFEVAGGEWEIFTTLPNGMIVSEYFLEPKVSSRTILAKGLYMVELVDLENGDFVPGTRSTFAFPVAPDQMPDPRDGGGWNLQVAVSDQDGLFAETQVYEFGTVQNQTYGACTYDMIPVNFWFGEGEIDPELYDVMHYLPQLGIAYLAEAKGGEYADVFDYVGISVVK